MTSPEAFYHLRTLFALRDAVEHLDPAGSPALHVVYLDPLLPPPSRLGILSGSFNPLTHAHLALAKAARAVYHLDEVFFAISRVTIEKETVREACLEDRLLLLRLFAEHHQGFGVVLVSHGLYADQAQAFRRTFPALAELDFLVGFDKVVQLFDPRYYADREAALHTFFAQARLITALRNGKSLEDLDRLLKRPEHRAFSTKVLPLSIPEEYRGLSATQVREMARQGHPIGAFVPEEVEGFIQATGLYAQPRRLPSGEEVEAYALRVLLLNALFRARPWAEEEGDFRGLLMLALSDTEEGQKLRDFLRNPPNDSPVARLKAFQVQREACYNTL